MADDLFQLIKALDKNEKGYFKKFAARYGEKTTGNDYLKLFDLLDKADEYNEETVKKHFAKAGKKFNLSAQKTYLYKQLIRCLRSYHSAQNSSYKLTESLLDIQNLTDKGLDGQAMELVETGIKKAFDSGNFSMELQFKTIRQSLVIRHLATYTAEEVTKLHVDIIETNERIGKNLLLEKLGFAMKALFDQVIAEGTLTPANKSMADEIINNPVFTDGINWGFNAKGKIYNAYYLHASINNNDIDSLKYLKLTNEMFKDMELDTKTTYQYLANISNIVLIALNMELMKEAGQQLNTLEHIRFKDTALEIYRQKLYSKNQLMYLTVLSQQRELTTQEILDAETNLLNCANPLLGNNNLMSCFYLSILFYVVNERDKALHWLQQAIDHEKVSLPTVQAYARLLCALIHYDQNNYSLMESALNNTQYFIKKNEVSAEYLKQMVSWFSKLPYADSTEKTALLKQMLSWLEKTNAERKDDEFTYLFDFNLLFWCRSNLNKTSYAYELRANKAQVMALETSTV